LLTISNYGSKTANIVGAKCYKQKVAGSIPDKVTGLFN
jgi:hypothetical protein